MMIEKTLSLKVCPSLGLDLVSSVVHVGVKTFGQVSVNVCSHGSEALRASNKSFIYIGPMFFLEPGVICKRLCLYALGAYDFVYSDEVSGNPFRDDAILTAEVGYKDRAAAIQNFADKNSTEIWFVDSLESMVAFAQRRRLRFISSDWKVRSLLHDGSIRRLAAFAPPPGAALYFVSNIDDDLIQGFRKAALELITQSVNAT
jgi:hypothetical protein